MAEELNAELDYDVLVVGGGLVGASLACALGGQPLKVGVLEAVPFERSGASSYDDRAIALSYGARLIFEAMGVWPAMAEAACAIRRIHVSDRGRFGAARLDCREQGVEALGYVIASRPLGGALLERVAQLDNVDYLCPARVLEVCAAGAAAELEVEIDGVRRTLRSRLLVAADGTRSAVRERLGVETLEEDYGQSAVIANVTPSRSHDHVAFERFTDTGPMAMLPLDGERCALVWTVPRERTEELLSLDDDAFLAALQERFGWRLGRILEVGPRSAYPLLQIFARRQVQPRLLLIGNAAHAMHPVAGQGFNLGLRDVAQLADLLVEALAVGQDPGAPELLERYARGRRDDQRYVMGATDALVRLFTNPAPPVRLLRDLGLVALDLTPPAKRAFTRYAMGLGGRLPRLARGASLAR